MSVDLPAPLGAGNGGHFAPPLEVQIDAYQCWSVTKAEVKVAGAQG